MTKVTKKTQPRQSLRYLMLAALGSILFGLSRWLRSQTNQIDRYAGKYWRDV